MTDRSRVPPLPDHKNPNRGEVVASLVARRPVVRALLSEMELAEALPAVGDRAWFRTRSGAGETLEGRVSRITPAGSRALDRGFTQHLDSAELSIDPTTGAAGKSLFEIEFVLDGTDARGSDARLSGMTGQLRLRGERAPLARVALRKLLVFTNRLRG